jgi:membrane-associated protein
MLSTVAHLPAGLIPWLDPTNVIDAVGAWALVVVCAFVFAETGLLVGFILPGDTLLVISGILSFGPHHVMPLNVFWVALFIVIAAFLGGEVGYAIGRKAGPPIFERKESGLFSRRNVERTNAFFERFGGIAVILARFVPIVRTFAPVAAGVGHMPWRRYSLYNAIGAVIWGAGLVVLGYLLNYIPPVRDFVTSYIDVILLCAALIAIVPTTFHAIRSSFAARRARREGVRPLDADEAALDSSVFGRHDGRDDRDEKAS